MLAVNISGQGSSEMRIYSGTVVYKDITEIEFNPEKMLRIESNPGSIHESVPAGALASIPKQNTLHRLLSFNEGVSLYRTDISNENNAPNRTVISHSPTRIIFNEIRQVTFSDIKNGRLIEQKEFMGRLFLIERPLSYPDWKLTGNTLRILGYDCQEAICNSSGKEVTAWFSSLIPVSSGPDGYGGLPGLILKVDVNNGEHTITAVKIESVDVENSSITAPAEGKKTTPMEFQKIVAEKMKELEKENGH